jgi:uroporphyrinogen-III synthase
MWASTKPPPWSALQVHQGLDGDWAVFASQEATISLFRELDLPLPHGLKVNAPPGASLTLINFETGETWRWSGDGWKRPPG